MASKKSTMQETSADVKAVEPSPATAIGGESALPWGIHLPERFAAINRLVMRDLNKKNASSPFGKYKKEDIQRFLNKPQNYSKQLRQVVIYLTGASPHFHRLVQYFTGLNDLNYVISPHRLDTTTANTKTIRRNYHRVLNLVSSMDLKNQGEKIVSTCLREDVFFGTIRESGESTIIQRLPSDYCDIAVIEDNVLNVSFDFSYFNRFPENLPLYPEEFRIKYALYQRHSNTMRWQELDAPNSFAIKANKDILDYAIPPFAGILRDIYDVEEYKEMKMTKTDIENYALLVMQLGVSSDGHWTMDLNKARDFWSNLDHVLPEEIGSVLSPMPINKISFERTRSSDSDTVAEAEQNLFTAAGVSSLLFNNEKASSNALLLSIKADQALTYSIVKSLECVLNRFIRRHSYGKYFKITFIDSSPFNRKEVGDAYLKACQYGLPMVSYYCASQGLLQDEMDGMNYLEDTVLGIKNRFLPLKSSATQSKNDSDSDSDGEAGRPESDLDELSEAGEQSREA